MESVAALAARGRSLLDDYAPPKAIQLLDRARDRIDAMPLMLKIFLSFVVGVYIVQRIQWELTTGRARRRLKAQTGCQPAKQLESWDPIFGFDILWDNIKNYRRHTLLQSRLDRLTPEGPHTLQGKVMGKTFLITTEAENLKTIQSVNFKQWCLGTDRQKTMTPYLGHGIFTNEGAAWQNSRDLLRPCFIRSSIGDIELLEKHVQRMLPHIPRDGTKIDMSEVFADLTLDIATEFLFGISTNCLSPEGPSDDTREFVKAFAFCQNLLEAEKSRHWLIRWLLGYETFQRSCAIVRDFADSLILAASKDGHFENDKYNFLQKLFAQTSDKARVRSELLNILLAGRDTTAALLTNVFFEVSRSQSIMDRLREEVASLNGVNPTYEELKNLHYLRAVLNESLRLLPVVPENARQAACDTVLPRGGGEDGQSPVFVPKGQTVVWSIFAMHRRQDIYGTDANEFHPERWLNNGDQKGIRAGWAFLPFNGGPRVCIGQQFALMQASYVTCRLIQEFSKIESRDTSPWTERMNITCSNLGGCKIGLYA